MAAHNLQIEKLTGRENYATWKFAVKSYLEHEELWECVDPNQKEIDVKKDIKAKSKIILLVEPINYVHIENAKSAQEVWRNLQNAFEDSGLSRKVGLLRDLINTSLDSCPSVEDYINKIMSTAYKLRNIGFAVDDEWLGTLMLAGLSDTYKPMIMGLESSGIKISSDFIKTKLLQEVKVSESSVFFIKHKTTSNNSNLKPKGKGPRCYNCNKYGHFRNQCTQKSKTNNNVFSAIFSAYSSVNKDDWYVDSGATMHMTRRSDWMYDVQPPPIQKIMVANSDAVSVQNMGKVNIQTNICNDEHQIQVRNVLYIPELSANLLSVSQLTKNGCKVEFTNAGCNIFNSQKILIATAQLTNRMYKLNIATGYACAVSLNESKADIDTWHKRMGHLNMADVRKLELCTEGIIITQKDASSVCKPCCEAKQTRLPFPHSGSRANTLLEIVHTDLCGPMETPSTGGAKYFITFIDDFSRKVYVYFIKNKLDITSVFKTFKNEVENELEKKIKIIRSDNGKEYCNKDFLNFLAASGIKHQTSTPYTPEQNGLAERMNRTLVERAKCMLFESKLLKGYWAEAVATAAYVINRSPSRVLAEVTPFEKWTGKKPNISHLKIFGAKAMVHIPKQNRLKWDRKSRELIFVGYCDNTKGYRLYDPCNKKIVISRDVIFLEDCIHTNTQKPVTMSNLNTTISLNSNDNEQVLECETSHTETQDINTTISPQSNEESNETSFDSCAMNRSDDETYYPDTSDNYDSSEVTDRNITLRSHQRGNNFLCTAQITDPLTVEEALSSADAGHWKKAMDEEYQSLISNNTWEVTTLPAQKRIIPCKWVFKTKTNENGDIVKYKARLVIKGCSQKKGLDYTEVFSPVVRLSSLRYLFALAVKHDLDIWQMDAVSAFLQGDIEEEIYMAQPPLYENGEKVCFLRKALYGLKQASRQWNKKLSSALIGMGLQQSQMDPCIYYKIVDLNNMLFLSIYVDDLLIFTNNKKSLENIKEELNKQFKMKDLGEVCYCIGIHVERDRKKGIIYLDQRKYIQEVLYKYGMGDCKAVKTPIEMNNKLQESSDETKILNDVPYQELIGCLLYISQVTRPDISFIINMLSKYNNKPENKHWMALKRVLRYLNGTKDYRLSYKQNINEKMTHGYCDADWASSEDDRRSCTGYIFMFQGGAISWNSKRQPTVALSTTEAEYMSLSSCVQEALWLKQFQETLWPALNNEAMSIYCDNQSCIKLSGTDVFHSRSKHIDVRHHFVRDKVLGGSITVNFIQTDEMVADILTKATSHSKLAYCSLMTDGSCKILHEELALQWVVASGATRDLAMQNSWSLFELMVKSMVEYLYWSGAHEAPRKARFPDHFTDDLTTLVNNLTSEIISKYGKNSRLTQSLNNSLAFFLMELLSIMDRGYVFNLIRTYYKQMSAKIASLPDAVPLVHYKLAFLRIVCSHEHYVSLNLPAGAAGGVGGTGGAGGCASPAASSRSAGCASPAASSRSAGSTSSAPPLHHLSHEFRSRHYLTGLLLTELTNALELQSPVLQCAAVGAVVALLSAHDADPRLRAPALKARVAALYLPLLAVAMDAHCQLHRGFSNTKEILQLDMEMGGQFSHLYSPSSPEGEFKQNGRPPFNSETSRNLVMCLVWVLKWADRAALAACVAELPASRLHTLLALVDLAFKCHEYKGRKEVMKCAQQNVRKTTDIKAKLEDVILGQGSARSDLIMRRKAGGPPACGKRERWRKEWVRAGSREAGASPLQPQPLLSAALAAEVSLTLLHALDTIVQTCSNMECGQSICSAALQVLLRALQRNQSVTVLQHMFATVRALIIKLGWSCCGEESGTCRVLLRHCAAASGAPRAHAAAALYALMRQHYELGNNFSRVKMQVTMSLSSLVGTSTTFSEESLRRALKTILVYAEKDVDLQDTTFPEQVKDLVFNLHMILSDTVKMKEFQEDPEMLLDLMHRIARGYQHSPDLRLTWLNNMAQKHMERSNHAEAGMCLVHGAALVAEQTCAGGRGAALLQHVTHNALDESCADALHHHLTHHELQALLEHAAGELMTAGMYETVNEVYKVLIPIAEEHRDYKKLANIHSKLNEAFTRIEQLHGKRVFGTYFRVSLYGPRFGDLHGEEFIYKEHALTKLPEIFSRLENFYGQRFGAENVVIIKDSNIVDYSTLDPDKAYIQITYVEPYFEPHELRKRITHYERNYNIKRFMYATPFTASGRAHGDIAEQCKRKTILTTAHHFPYVKTRIQVVQRTTIILSPIEVAIEDIQKKIHELAAATQQEPADPKMLQMVVQGCIGTTVNQGPLELAQVFLAPVAEGTQPPTRLTNKLRLSFKDFSKKCHDALRKNKNLIGSDQREYQRELERNFARFTDRLAPLVLAAPGHVAQLSNGMSKPDYKYQA